ncbi:MAG TPA: hypothetical protein VK522_13030 [Pseudolabrys sp.]|nr:hypothetical protein [Pseudolabrys sp.]
MPRRAWPRRHAAAAVAMPASFLHLREPNGRVHMQINDPFESSIKIKAENLPELRFASPKEVVDWLQSEQQFYFDIFEDKGRSDPPLTRAAGGCAQFLSKLSSRFKI